MSNGLCLTGVAGRSSDSTDSEDNTEVLEDGRDEGEEGEDETVELMALYLHGCRRVGCARYSSRTCRVEVFEVPVQLGVESGGGNGGWGNSTPSHVIPITSELDIPPSLLWLVQCIRVYHPLLFLPDTGAQPLEEIAIAVGAPYTKLQSKTAFDCREALPRLRAMYPQLTVSDIRGRFNLSNSASLAAMSALLHYTASVSCNVGDIVERPPLSLLYVEDATAQWLQLTRTERHPCDYQGIGRAKEGLSLFTTVNYAVTAHGRSMLRQWFRLPSCDALELAQRQRVVGLFTAPGHRDALQQLRRALLHVKPTNRVFTAMRSGRATLPHFQSLLRTIKGLLTVHEVLYPIAHQADSLLSLMNSVDIGRLQAMTALLEARVYRIGVAPSRKGQCGLGERGSAAGWDPVTAAAVQFPSSRGSPGGGGAADDIAWVAYVQTGGLRSRRVSFNLGVDGHLDELRLLHTRLPVLLSMTAQEVLQELPAPLRSGVAVRCVFVAAYGYLLTVTDGEGTTTARGSGGDVWGDMGLYNTASADTYGPPNAMVDRRAFDGAATVAEILTEQLGWELQYSAAACEDGPADLTEPAVGTGRAAATFFFKNERMRALDTEVGNLLQRIRAREDGLRSQLEASLLRDSLCLLQPAQAVAELDCLLGFAHCAAYRQWVCPQLVEQPGVLSITDGWHPLLQQTLCIQPVFRTGCDVGNGTGSGAVGDGTVSDSALVSFSFHVRDAHERVCVVTGASGSGKSTLITAVAQIVFLAHLGCFVPAAAATIGLTRRLCACSGVSRWEPLSSFEAECVSLNRIVQQCAMERAMAATTETEAPGTLILVDDFGRGTCPNDAVALLGATLRFLAQTAPPLVLCATHFTELLPTLSPRALVPAQGIARASPQPSLEDPVNMAVYCMRCIAVCSEGGENTPAAASGAAAATAPSCVQVPVDVIPSFEAVRVPDAVLRDRDCGEWAESHCIRATGSGSEQLITAPAAALCVARRCGLSDSVLSLWAATLRALREAARPPCDGGGAAFPSPREGTRESTDC